MNKKHAIVTVALMLVVCVASIGGTLAWLTDKTAPVVNTFTKSNVAISLAETTGATYKMVPGADITKDPKVTVSANSEASWVFVKIEKSTNKAFDDYMTFNIADGWTELTADSGIYYRSQDATNANVDIAVLRDNKVSVKNTVTKAMMDELSADNYPKLTITAYAIQQEGFDNAEDAWEEVSKPAN